MEREKLINYLSIGIPENDIFDLLKEYAERNNKELTKDLFTLVYRDMFGRHIVEQVLNRYLDILSIEMSVIKVFDKNNKIVRYC